MTKLPTPENFLDTNGNIIDPYRSFIAVSRYARWLENEQRRETWTETVNRYVNFMTKTQEQRGNKISKKLKKEITHAITYHHVMPSMRALMTAGPALEKNNIAGYNCSFIAVDNIRAFDETLLILMHGTGVGFSIEQKHIQKLPEIAETFHKTNTIVKVTDSKEGWAKAYKEYLALLWSGQLPTYDVTELRPKGARLKTFGGRSSGPSALVDLFEFTAQKLQQAAGRKLRPIEAHDIMCKIGEIVVVGGVRRSALISMSDLSDREMSEAKSGAWWNNEPQRALANNSATYYTKPTMEAFFNEWKSLYDSKSGERGIVNLNAARTQANNSERRDGNLIEGTNPCGEIALRNKGFCNLTEIVVNEQDTLETLLEKTRLATILGTWQASLTHFPYLRRKWKENADEEALLGVSLTGIYGHPILNGQKNEEELITWLKTLKQHAITTNKKEAQKTGINPAAAITCVKPSGTVSQLTGVSSGLHPWHARKYVRRVRGANTDPLTQMMIQNGVPSEPAVTHPTEYTVFEFPIESPPNAITQHDVTALDHLKQWLLYRRHYCDHNPSITVTVKEHEWFAVGAFVYENFDEMAGVSFLPSAGNHTYQQAPYEELNEEQFTQLQQESVTIPWDKLPAYELEDTSSGTQELACTGGSCEIVDITPDNNTPEPTQKLSKLAITLEKKDSKQ